MTISDQTLQHAEPQHAQPREIPSITIIIKPGLSLDDARWLIVKHVFAHTRNITETARILGVSRRSLYNWAIERKEPFHEREPTPEPLKDLTGCDV